MPTQKPRAMIVVEDADREWASELAKPFGTWQKVMKSLLDERLELAHVGWMPKDADTLILLKAIVGLSDHDRQALLLWLSENAARPTIDSSSISEKGILSKRRTNG